MCAPFRYRGAWDRAALRLGAQGLIAGRTWAGVPVSSQGARIFLPVSRPLLAAAGLPVPAWRAGLPEPEGNLTVISRGSPGRAENLC